jgi:hypothetical protein
MAEAAERTSDPHAAAVFAELSDKWINLAEMTYRYSDTDDVPSLQDRCEANPTPVAAPVRHI